MDVDVDVDVDVDAPAAAGFLFGLGFSSSSGGTGSACATLNGFSAGALSGPAPHLRNGSSVAAPASLPLKLTLPFSAPIPTPSAFPVNSTGQSTATVAVMPEPDEVEVQIKEDDLKIDVFRSSGHGGQSVNTTDSAVRITHLPTGIVVQCQNERSQLQNKARAMAILQSKLAVLAHQQRLEHLDQIRGEQGEAAWGNQIRSYVLQPYQMVKDLRTREEVGNVQGVLDGDLMPFVESYLRWRRANHESGSDSA